MLSTSSNVNYRAAFWASLSLKGNLKKILANGVRSLKHAFSGADFV